MAVRFKFRSSAILDSVDLQGRQSISVRDLKSKIVLHKHLSLCQDFDLVLSDSVTGQEYHDDNFQIMNGSCVIFKRVPAGSTPSVMPHNGLAEKVQTEYAYAVNTSPTMVVEQEKNMELDDFDNFGIDLCPVPETALFNSNLDIDKEICSDSERNDIEVSRCLNLPMVRCQKLKSSDLSDAICRGPMHEEGKTLQIKSRPKVDVQLTSEKMVKANPSPIQNVDWPSELKCSLCDTFFKNAVMIPCCQHSFCEECIHSVLIEEARCPKCICTKFGVQDLLPNISLRQAIEHFLESQLLATGSENGLHRYAPDCESGIQAKEVSCAASVTTRPSNQIMGESAYDSLCKNIASTSHVKHSDFKSEHEGLGMLSDFQGESQPVQEEADSTVKRKTGLQVGTAGGAKSLLETGRYRKGGRTCYMCGSPDHLIRDCPQATSLHPMLQTGNAMLPRAMPSFAQPYWNGSPVAHVPLFPNHYGHPPGMMHFNAAMAPAATFAFPAYMPYIYGGLPTFGFTRAEGAGTPRGTNAGDHVSYSEFLDLQHIENAWKLSNGKRRERCFDDNDDDGNNKMSSYNEADRSNDRKSHVNRGKSHSCSEDSSTRVSRRKHYPDVHLDDSIHSDDTRHEKKSRPSIAGRDKKQYYRPESSSSDVGSSVCHGGEKYKHHHRISEMHNQKTERHGHDYGRSRHQSTKEKDARKRVDSDRQNQKHHYSSESGLEPSSNDHSTQRRKRGSDHSSKCSKHDGPKSRISFPQSVDDGEDNYQYYKQRRVRHKS